MTLGPAQGVLAPCKPDFVIRPLGKSDTLAGTGALAGTGKLPIAIFTDGFLYHKDKVADDTLKREAIRRSGGYRVWALSWRDVQYVFHRKGGYATPTLTPENMPSGAAMYQPTVDAGKAAALKPGNMSAFELLMRYLEMEDSEKLFAAQARAYALSILEPGKAGDGLAFVDWKNKVGTANEQLQFTEDNFTQPGAWFGTWIPRSADAHFYAYAGVLPSNLKADGKNAPITVLALLDDRPDARTDKYEQEWNGFWQFFNVMQFNTQNSHNSHM